MLSGTVLPLSVAVAFRVLSRAAAIEGAPSLLPIEQAHIDGCTYIGPGGLRFAQTLAEMGGQVAVPTTLNSNSVDRRQWRALGISPTLGEPVGVENKEIISFALHPSHLTWLITSIYYTIY